MVRPLLLSLGQRGTTYYDNNDNKNNNNNNRYYCGRWGEGEKYNTTYQRFVCKICTCTLLPDTPPLDLLPLQCLDDLEFECL